MIAVSDASDIVTVQINNAIAEIMGQGDYDGESFVTFEKNSSGNWNEILCEDLLTMIIYNPPTDNYSPLLNALFKTNYVGSSESFLWQKVKTDISYKGMDGTCVGIYGGSGFSDYSSIPHIIESTIESDTDSNGKLSVKLKVSVNQ